MTLNKLRVAQIYPLRIYGVDSYPVEIVDLYQLYDGMVVYFSNGDWLCSFNTTVEEVRRLLGRDYASISKVKGVSTEDLTESEEKFFINTVKTLATWS